MSLRVKSDFEIVIPMPQIGEKLIVDRKDLDQLFTALLKNGYQVMGPTVRDEGIIYDDLNSMKDLPIGWTDEQDAGTYRIKKRSDHALFGLWWVPTPGKDFSSLRPSDYGEPNRKAISFISSLKIFPFQNLPSSVFAPVSSMP